MFLPSLGPSEMLVVGVIAVLLFGKRLPEVGRSLGKGIVEFKKGLRGIDDDFDGSSGVPARYGDTGTSSHAASPDYAVPKFEPPTTAPADLGGYEPKPHQG